MTELIAEKRDMSVKAKKMRRDGFIPCNLYGREMKEPIPVKLGVLEADRFLRANKKGSRVNLKLDGEEYKALVKDTGYDSLKKQILFIDFQKLEKGEKVLATAPIVFVNEDKARGTIQQEIEEITYKAEPDDLVDNIVIDFEKLGTQKVVKVEDLELAKNSRVKIMTPADALIVSVSEFAGVVEDDDATEEAAEK